MARQSPLDQLSPRLSAILNALPLISGMRILEIGCGPGALARAIAQRKGHGKVMGIDRSAKAIAHATASSQLEISNGILSFRQIAIEHFDLGSEPPFDLAVAVRVGALDGRHPEIAHQALIKIAGALTPHGKLYIDGGNPLKEIPLDAYRPITR